MQLAPDKPVGHWVGKVGKVGTRLGGDPVVVDFEVLKYQLPSDLPRS